MNKVIVYVEKYVQWLAIALGVAWLGWMAWSYLVNSPASVSLDNVPSLTPSTIDPHIKDTEDKALTDAMIRSTAETVVMNVPDMTKPYVTDLEGTGPAAPALAGAFNTPMPVVVNLETGPNQNNQKVVIALPSLPATTPLVPPEQGRSTVTLPDGVNLQGPAQVQAAANVAPGAPPAPAQLDTDWVTVFTKVPMDSLTAEFNKAFPPVLAAAVTQTEFLNAELVRQELVLGVWGKQTVVDRLLNQTPGLNPPLPDEVIAWPNNAAAENAYIAWASQHTDSLIEPPFYETAAGDTWVGLQAWETALEAKAEAAAAPATPAVQPGAGHPPPSPPQPPRRIPGSQAGGGNNFQGRPGFPSPGGSDAGMAGRPGYPPSLYPPGYHPATNARPQQPQQQQPQPAPPSTPAANLPSAEALGFDPNAPAPVLPKGYFNPGEGAADGDALIYLHDANAAPGRTYRYMIRYQLLNPMYGRPQFVKNAALAVQYTLDSPEGKWTRAVTINPRVFFVVSAGIANENSAHFDVYAWSGGKWLKETFTASPGDEIGAIKDGHDFSTGWTLVDLPASRDGDRYAIVVNDDGEVAQRDQRGDAVKGSPIDKLLDQVNQQGGAADASAVGAGTGGS